MLGHVVLSVSLLLQAQGAAWADRSPHRVSRAPIRSALSLEVLDWGGDGPALIFLAGFGDTAHVFDGFAPQFTDRFHVFGITRRGFGASNRPTDGYDSATLAQDITLVLDALGLRRATFVGHSFAGTELNYLGAFHPERVTKLVYLDASYDFARLYADPRWKQAFPIPRPPLPPPDDLEARTRWFALTLGPGFPEAEVRALDAAPAQPSLDETLQVGTAPSAFARIKRAVLALWATPRSVQEQSPYWALLPPRDCVRLEESFALTQTVRRIHARRFGQEVAGARLVPIRGGRHFLFLSHPKQVAAAMRRFLTE